MRLTQKGNDTMETKDAGTGAAVAVLLAILGLIVMVGVILLMMWKQPGIEHSPSQQSRLCLPDAALEFSLEVHTAPRFEILQCLGVLGSET
jgi:hypothetical protein